MKYEYRRPFAVSSKKYGRNILLLVIPAHLLFPGIEYDTPVSNKDLRSHLEEMQ